MVHRHCPRISLARARGRVLPVYLCAAALLALAACSPARSISRPTSAIVPTLDHVVVVVMENTSYDEARAGAYVSTLIRAGSSFSQDRAVAHPSQPNYLALWAGSALGVADDTCPPPGSPFTAENLGHACEAAGLSWRAYSEDLPAAGADTCSANGALYVRKHEPWTDFSNLDHTNERPFTDLAADLAAGALPNLAFIVPNTCDDSHDCSVAQGDAWLAQHVPALLSAVGAKGIVVVTWDEDDRQAGNHILTVIQGATVKRGFVSARPITHLTLLRTITDGLGLRAFGNAASESPITDVWSSAVANASERTGRTLSAGAAQH